MSYVGLPDNCAATRPACASRPGGSWRGTGRLPPERTGDGSSRRGPSHRAPDADVVLRRHRSALMPAPGLTARRARRYVAPMPSSMVSGDTGELADGRERVEIGSRLRHALHSKNSRNAVLRVCTRRNDRMASPRKIATVATRDLWRRCLSRVSRFISAVYMRPTIQHHRQRLSRAIELHLVCSCSRQRAWRLRTILGQAHGQR